MTRRFRNTYFLLRHGQADHIISGTIASKNTEATNPPHLTKVGISQARKAAEELAGKGISMIYSSPYARTMETAEIVAERLGLKVVQDDRLVEIDAGFLDGKSIEEYREFFRKPEEELTKKAGGGEDLYDVRDRVNGFLDDVEKKYDNESILVVGHAASLMALESVYTGKGILEISYRAGEWRKL